MQIMDKIKTQMEIEKNDKQYDVDNIIDEYIQNYKGNIKTLSIYNKLLSSNEYLKLVGKIVKFYTLKYSDSEIHRMYLSLENNNIFNNNDQISNYLSEYSEENQKLIIDFLNKITWNDIYSTSNFINSLIPKEKVYLDGTDRVLKKDILELTMYVLINQDRIIGPKRAYLFAKEFGLNKDIPVMYGISPIDPYLNEFIDGYLTDGGDKNLLCITNYDKRKEYHLNFTSIEYIQNKLANQIQNKQTIEKTECEIEEERQLKARINDAYQKKLLKYSIDSNN